MSRPTLSKPRFRLARSKKNSSVASQLNNKEVLEGARYRLNPPVKYSYKVYMRLLDDQ